MPIGTKPFMHDRAMSLHRRAYACSQSEWEELAPKLGLHDPAAIERIWRTALKARAAGMTAKQAFPLQADIKSTAECVVHQYLDCEQRRNDSACAGIDALLHTLL